MQKKSGVYKFTSPTGRIYIGSSADILKRFQYYKATNAPKQILLHRSFLKHGFDNHKFEIIHECSPSIRLDMERYYGEINKSLSDFGGLNLMLPKIGDKPASYSAELRAKFAEIGRNRTYKPETIQKFKMARIGKYAGGNHPQAKIVIHSQYGIFYDCIKNAAEANGIKRSLLNAKLLGIVKNNTHLIYA